MLSDKVEVPTHSILGTVSEFNQHRALEDENKENDAFTLSLPPIFQHKNVKENLDNNESKNALNSPTIPSLFSPMTKNAQYRYKSNLKDLIRGHKIEKAKENRKLQQLLKGDRIYATREERVLKRWDQQQKQWSSLKKNIAQKIGKTQKELVITRAEEWRETIEEIDLMSKSIPNSSMSANHWQYSLRKKTGNEESTYLVPIGNMFSGLYCKVTQNPRKPMKETVRKPRKSTKNTNPNHYNLPGKGAASKHWRERSVTYLFRKRLHKKMCKLKPNNLDELDGLEIIGSNMFNICKLKLPSYSYERLNENKSQKPKKNENNSEMDSYFDDESYQFVQHENIPIIGPCLQFMPENIILFNASLHEEQIKVLEMKNVGTTAMLLRFENVEQIFKDAAKFMYPTEQFSILPGDTKCIAFYFKPSKPGSYHLVIGLESSPCISQKYIELQAMCRIDDEDKIHRQRFIKQMTTNQIKQDAADLLSNMIQSIVEPVAETNNLAQLFCEANRDHKLYWHAEVLDELQILSKNIISKFRRRKRKSYKWDLSVATLKIWLKELENIAPESVIKSLSVQLSECINSARQIPPPNPLYYDLCSTLINDLSLQIPRFAWRANQFTKIKGNDEDNANEQKDDKDNENKLYQDCNEYLCHIINQFENSVINDNEIDECTMKAIKSKLDPKPERIITFGSWVNQETNESMKCAEIAPLYNHCIQSIHCNSKITIMSSLYKTWICSNKQSFKTVEENNADQDGEKQVSMLNDFKLLPIFKGFNVIQIFCCEDMINILTDSGDVYCSVLRDLTFHQTEILYNKNIIKICGSSPNNKCVALSDCGEIFEWSLISEETQIAAADTDNGEEEKKKEEMPKIFTISPAKQLSEIDEKVKDIAMTTSAYAAITVNGKLIIWGDFSAIYSANVIKKDDKKKKTKNQAKAEKKEEAENRTESCYTIIELKEINKYKNIVSCLNSFIVLEENGNLYSFGNGENGSLGLGVEVNESLQPTLIQFENESANIVIDCVSSWTNGCIAIDNNANIYYWGKCFEKLNSEISEITETENDNDKEQQAKQETAFYVPTKIKIEPQIKQITKLVAANVGGFLWS